MFTLEEAQREKKIDPESNREYWLYPDGTEKWADNGHFRRGPLETPVTRDPAGMRLLRVEKSQQIARQANENVLMELGLIDTNRTGTDYGYLLYCESFFRSYYKTENHRAKVEAFPKGVQIMGYATKEEGSGREFDDAHTVSVARYRYAIREVIRRAEGKVINA